jgi:hypothetical protein
MKKLSFAIIMAAIVTHVVQAQVAGTGFSSYEKETGAATYKFLVTGINGNTASIKDVNIKAAKDFSRSRKKAEDIHWYVDTRGYFAYYFINGNKGWSFYDKKGNFVYNIQTLTEESLPPEIRDLVKRTYYLDYKIDFAKEVQTDGKTVYIVNISDDKTIKILNIFDGEITVLNELIKSR